MPTSFSFGKIQFDVSLGTAAARAPRTPEASFSLLVLGDFSGRTNRGVVEPLAARRPIRVDCDNVEQVLAQLAAGLRLPSAGTPGTSLELRFASREDFHPDQILKQVSALAALLDVRRRLQNPATAAAAVVDSQSLLAVSSPPSAPVGTTETTAATLARLMGSAPEAKAAPAKSSSAGFDLNALIKQIAAPSAVPGATPEQSTALAVVEAELVAQMRAILHHADFQSLEALWRGLDLLVREYGAEDNLELYLLDSTKEELAADLKAQENLAQSALFRALQDRAWAVLLGDYMFADTLEEMETLGRIAHVAARLGGAFLAGASSRLVGCESLVTQPDPNAWLQPLSPASREAWAALRALPEASHLGLALPRVILRQPYGKGSDPIEAFPFEEFPGDPRHDDYLWGNGAFVCAYLLAAAFRAEGWELSGTGSGELDDLPVHRFTEEGEIKVKPCAEVWLSERAADRVLSHGLMPLLSIKGRGAVRLANLQSVAQKPVAW